MKTNKCTAVFDESGHFNPQYDNSDVLDLESDCIILATGQRVDIDFLGEKLRDQIKSSRGLIDVDENNSTRCPSVFAGGDAATGPNVAIRAIFAGGNAARAMSAYMGCPIKAENSRENFLRSEQEHIFEPESHKLAELPVSERSLTKEDESSYPEGIASCEAGRCMNCGCLAVNPSDMANMLYAYNATIITNQRTIEAKKFFAENARIRDTLKSGEIVTEIIVPAPKPGTIARYNKFRVRDAIDFAVVAVASVITKHPDGAVEMPALYSEQ